MSAPEKTDIELLEAGEDTNAQAELYNRYGSDEESRAAFQTILNWSPEEFAAHQRKLVRRLDLTIGFPIVVLYVLNYLDRNSIAQARVSGLVKDTHITQNDYALVNGIFYISYILCQTPANMVIAKTRPSIFIPCVVILWAIVSSLTAVCTSLGHLIAVRFILGIVEGPFYPGAVFYLSCWYTRKEIGKRISLLVSGICLSNAIAGLISTGILKGLSEKHGIAGWKWIFIIEGCITVGVGACAFFVLPDYPSTSKQLSTQNRILAQYRLDLDFGTGPEPDVAVMVGFKMAVRDWRTWLFGTLQASITIMIGFNFFYPTLIKGIGYKNTYTILLLTVPPYVLALIMSLLISARADKTQRRAFHYLICVGIAAVGLILLIALSKVDSPGAKYFATFVLAAGSFPAYACSYPWLAGLMPRPASKRAVAVAIANSMSNIGAFVSGYIYYAPFGPTYLVSWCITLGFAVYTACAVTFLWYKTGQRNVHLSHLEEKYNRGEISEIEFERLDADEQMSAKSGFRLVR